MGWGAESLILGQLKSNLSFFLQLKSRSARGAPHHPAFMVLVLIKGMRRGGESKIFFFTPGV